MAVSDVQWEGGCDYADATILEFSRWLEGRRDEDGPFAKYDPQTHWCYADYKYMHELFDADSLKVTNCYVCSR